MEPTVTELGHLETRVAHLEREVRRWRLTFLLAAGVVSAVACNGAPPPAPSAIELASDDGLRRVRLTADGLWVENGSRSARFAAGEAFVREGELGLSLAPGQVSIAGEDGRHASMDLGSIAVANGSGTVRAEISIEGGGVGVVRATGEHGSAMLGATGSEASLALEGGTETSIRALANGALVDVAVTGTGDRVVHLRPE